MHKALRKLLYMQANIHRKLTAAFARYAAEHGFQLFGWRSLLSNETLGTDNLGQSEYS